MQQLPFSVHILHPVGQAAYFSSPCRFGPALALIYSEGTKNMLWTLFVILIVLWALGMLTSFTAGGLIHILLVVALIVLVFNLISGRRAAA